MRLTCHYVLLLSTVLASHATAQQVKEGDTVSTGATKRTVLSVQNFPPGYRTMKLIAENAPGSCSGRHSHPGIETSYLVDGEVTFTIDGKPPTAYKAGVSSLTLATTIVISSRGGSVRQKPPALIALPHRRCAPSRHSPAPGPRYPRLSPG